MSAMPFSACDVPHLDLFDLYHLYHHIESREGRVRHSLRLGFFKEAAAAQAIANYAAVYFPSPRIAQITGLEEAESESRTFRATKDVGASGQFAAIELSTPQPVRSVLTAGVRSSTAAAVPRWREERSLWARLFVPRQG